MNMIRKTLKPLSISLAVVMLLIGVPAHPMLATMIETEAVINSAHGREAREYLHQLLVRKDIQDAFITQGIDPVRQRHELTACPIMR